MQRDTEDDRDIPSTQREGDAPRALGDSPTLPDPSAKGPRPSDDRRDTRYRRVSLLGLGGMGEVHLCEDRVIGREIAMKRMIEGSGASRRAVARFAREALLQARLEHPSIVPVYDVSLEPADRAWFTMKRLQGRSLHDILRALAEGDRATEESFSQRKLLTAFVHVCLAVDYAHSRGVIHRDLKPANLMFGEFGEVSVLDWGLAKILTADGRAPLLEPGDDVTLTGSLLGTPGYMAPEQAVGVEGPLDGRADVYALGAILFEILALSPLHEGQASLRILTATIEGVDARPSARGVVVAPELEAACVRATALSPADRFPTARALAQAIERFLDGDRDLERRRQLAAEHVQKAESALAREREPGARAEAMRELGRAVALDPTSEVAVDTLGRLLVEAPTVVPDEARRELVELRDGQLREAARIAARRYLLWCGFASLSLTMGVRSWSAAGVVFSLFALTALFALWLARRHRVELPQGVGLLAASSLTIAAVSSMFGWFIIVPGLAATNTMFFFMSAPRRYRPSIAAVGALAIALPALAEILGLVPPSCAFVPEGMLIVPRGANFPEVPSTAVLLVISIATVLIPAVMVGRLRDALSEAERRLLIQAWHLRQLLPHGVARTGRAA